MTRSRSSFLSVATVSTLLLAPMPLAGRPPILAQPPRHDPARRVYFKIHFEEQGSGAGDDWKMQGDALYALLPAWDGARMWGYDAPAEVSKRLGGQAAPTSEKLFDLRGGFAQLKQNEALQFYIKEITVVGNGSWGRRKLSWTRSKRDGVGTSDGCGVKDSHTDEGSLDEKNATLRRTASGGNLFFGWEITGDQGCEWTETLAITAGSRYLEQVKDRLLAFKLTEEQLRSWSSIHVVNDVTVTGPDGIRIQAKATLLPAPVPVDDVEVTLEPVPEDHYEKWLPAGNLASPEKPGNTLTVTATVHKAGDPAKPREAQLKFGLDEVSEQRGVCTNWPRGKEAVSKNDLRFRQQDQAKGAAIEVTTETQARTTDFVEKVTLVVSVFDFAASGTLTVSGIDRTGRPIKVTVKANGREKPVLKVPLDENGNGIADVWENDNVLREASPSSDDETEPPGKREVQGDGLSLWEEYRGFSVQGKHVRGDPNKKDLFVADGTLLKRAGPGIDLFETISGLVVHRVEPRELGDNRVINSNEKKFHLVDQHGVLIIDGVGKGAPEAIKLEGAGDDPGPPGMTRWIVLPIAAKMDAEGVATLAHELGHTVGIAHHGRELYSVLWWWGADGKLWQQGLEASSDIPKRLGKAKIVVAFWENAPGGGGFRRFQKGDPWPAGFEFVPAEKGWRGHSHGRHGQNSGNTSCVMAYKIMGAYEPFENDDTTKYVFDKGDTTAQTLLCSDKVGTGVNDKSHSPVSRYGDAAAGNCKGQIVVKDTEP